MEKNAQNSLKLSEFATLLDWYQAMGVDVAIKEQPINWFDKGATVDNGLLAALTTNLALSTPKKSNRPSPSLDRPIEDKPTARPADITPSPAPTKTAPLALPSLELASQLATDSQSLTELGKKLETYDGCGLKRTAKNLVFYRGSEQAPLMIIGEAPGRDEDIVGKPFVGRAGQLLDLMLKAIGCSEADTHITNIVYWRPPGNRTPTQEEGALCRPFLNRQIELVKPEVILFLGGAAAKQIYETATGITKLRGKWRGVTFNQRKIDTMATLHPAYLLRTPIAKRLAWQDLLSVQKRLEENHGR